MYNNKGKIINPLGKWEGTYFSEELKAAIKYGYKIHVKKAYLFSRAKIFNSYIEHFYDKKKN